jgi:predicted methyltransferase
MSHRSFTARIFGGALLTALGCGSPAPAQAPATPTPTPSANAAAALSVSAAEAPNAPAASATPAAQALDPKAHADAVVAAADRSAEDRALDAQRHPAELLAFFGILPGQRLAELGAGGGYTTELLVRATGESGKVYGQNSKALLEKFLEKPWSERLAKPLMKNVVRLDRDFDSPLPPDVKELDAVLMVLFYHDTVWLKVDRERMNQSVFAALKPGGIYGIVDHSAKPGAGIGVTETLHRIEKSALVSEVTKAGFALEAEASFLANPADTRDWNDSPRKAEARRGTSDRFVLRFKKPAR